MDVSRFFPSQYLYDNHTDKYYGTLMETIIQRRKFNKEIPLTFDT